MSDFEEMLKADLGKVLEKHRVLRDSWSCICDENYSSVHTFETFRDHQSEKIVEALGRVYLERGEMDPVTKRVKLHGPDPTQISDPVQVGRFKTTSEWLVL